MDPPLLQLLRSGFLLTGPVLLHKLHRRTFIPARLVLEGEQLVTCAPAASWSVQSGLEEILRRPLLEGGRPSLLRGRGHRVVPLQTDRRQNSSTFKATKSKNFKHFPKSIFKFKHIPDPENQHFPNSEPCREETSLSDWTERSILPHR